MQELDYCKGLRCYGVYKFEKYPEWDVLVFDMDVDNQNRNYLKGYAFSLSGRFQTEVDLVLPLIGQEVGYIYTPNVAYSLHLEFHNRS